jgi:regulator of CtrA degradation
MSKVGQGPALQRPVNFLARFAASPQFHKVFCDGMALVEETANYLDGPGRQDARGLDRHGAIAYATESMRLTTRLMQLASWLLLQRAVSQGELTDEAAAAEKHRINLGEIGAGAPVQGSDQLPPALQLLVQRSLHLHFRILRLDRLTVDERTPAAGTANPVASQVDRLQRVFVKAR